MATHNPPAHSGYTHRPIEISFTAGKSYADIFNEVEVDVIFADESGISWRVPAFWAGDNVFRARFAAPRPGAYTWRSESTHVDDSGLHGKTGALNAVAYDGRCELYHRGRLRVADSKRTLEHSDGTPFLWLADTWWMGLTRRLDWPDGFRRMVEDRVRKGFNTIQIVAGPLPDFCATTATWDPQQANEAGWPWEKEFARINPAFYDAADVRLAFMIEQGLVPCIVGMWGYYLPFMGVERCRKHWRNLVARYGAYPVVWCLCGECTMPTYGRHGTPQYELDRDAQKSGWTEIARAVHTMDAFDNPVTVHPSSSGRLSLEDETLVDFDMLQTGHSGYLSLQPSVEAMQQAVSRQPRMPVLNSEACYEGIMGGSKDEVQRFLFWTSMLLGACGHTYGAQGIWAMSSRDEPFRGTTSSWGEGFWQDVMHYAGSAHVGVGASILRRYQWWRLEPLEYSGAAEEPIRFAAHIPGQLIIAYLPCRCVPPSMLGDCHFEIDIDNGLSYKASYVDPRTGRVIPLGKVQPVDDRWAPPPRPGMDDWLLILEAIQ